MELDIRSRTWIVTIPWTVPMTPTESCIPSILTFIKAHAKYSKDNGSVSTWLTFRNQTRASTVTNAYSVDVVIKKVTPGLSLTDFIMMSHDWEYTIDRSDSVGVAAIKRDNIKIDDSVGVIVGKNNIDDSDGVIVDKNKRDSAGVTHDDNLIILIKRRRVIKDELDLVHSQIREYIN